MVFSILLGLSMCVGLRSDLVTLKKSRQFVRFDAGCIRMPATKIHLEVFKSHVGLSSMLRSFEFVFRHFLFAKSFNVWKGLLKWSKPRSSMWCDLDFYQIFPQNHLDKCSFQDLGFEILGKLIIYDYFVKLLAF